MKKNEKEKRKWKERRKMKRREGKKRSEGSGGNDQRRNTFSASASLCVCPTSLLLK
jgi:hypothetical protein